MKLFLARDDEWINMIWRDVRMKIITAFPD